MGHDAVRVCTAQLRAVPCRAITHSKQNCRRIWNFFLLFQASAERATELGAKWFSNAKAFLELCICQLIKLNWVCSFKILESILIRIFLEELMMESLHAFKHTDQSIFLRQNCCSVRKNNENTFRYILQGVVPTRFSTWNDKYWVAVRIQIQEWCKCRCFLIIEKHKRRREIDPALWPFQ